MRAQKLILHAFLQPNGKRNAFVDKEVHDASASKSAVGVKI
jgi:hypothetical protein